MAQALFVLAVQRRSISQQAVLIAASREEAKRAAQFVIVTFALHMVRVLYILQIGKRPRCPRGGTGSHAQDAEGLEDRDNNKTPPHRKRILNS
jgi:hypothetical protein